MFNHPLLQELRNNTRLRIGIWLILAILIFYGLLSLQESNQKIASDYYQQVEQLEQLKRILQQTEWQERAMAAKDRRLQLEEKLWKASSLGLAQADILAWWNAQFSRLKIKAPRVRVETPMVIERGEQTLWQVSAQLEGDFQPQILYELLLAMAEHPQWLITERLEVRPLASKMRFTLMASAYFQAL